MLYSNSGHYDSKNEVIIADETKIENLQKFTYAEEIAKAILKQSEIQSKLVFIKCKTYFDSEYHYTYRFVTIKFVNFEICYPVTMSGRDFVVGDGGVGIPTLSIGGSNPEFIKDAFHDKLLQDAKFHETLKFLAKQEDQDYILFKAL